MVNLQALTAKDISQIIPFIQELNPELNPAVIQENQREMFNISNYRCFGLFQGDNLIGLSSGWITIRHYSGKQIEIDNVIIASTHQSKGYGAQFIELLEQWSREQDCKTMELNSYLTNPRSHKFYFTQGFKILGFHFYKDLWFNPRWYSNLWKVELSFGYEELFVDLKIRDIASRVQNEIDEKSKRLEIHLPP